MNCIGSSFYIVFAVLGAADDYPSLPNLQERINYIAWFEQSRPEVSEEDNAYHAYAQFMPNLVGSSVREDDWPKFEGMLTTPRLPGPAGAGGARASRNVDPPPAPWHPKRKTDWYASYKRTKKILKQYTAASGRKTLATRLGRDGKADNKNNLIQNIELHHLRYIRQCAEGKLEAAWRMKKGKVSPSLFISAIETNLRVSNQLRDSILSVEQAVAWKIRTVTYQHARWAFAHDVLTEEHAGKLAKLLRKIDKEPIDASNILKGECLIWLDDLQYIYGPLTGGGLKLNGIRYKEVTGQNMGSSNRFGLGARIERDPQGAAKAILDAYVAMEEHMQPGFTMHHYRSLGVIANRMRDANKLTKALMLSLGANYGRFYQMAAICESERRATRLLVELFAYKQKKGRWPKKLTKLGKKVPDNIKQDAFRDKQFVYMLLDDEPVLYSVALNGEDDGGSHDPDWNFSVDGDYIYWPIPDSENVLAASKLNRVPDKDLTPISAIDADDQDKLVTVAAEVKEVGSRPSKKHGRRYSVILSQDGATIELIYYQSVADELTPNQEIKPGIRIRVRAAVENKNKTRRLKLKDPKLIAIEE